MEKEGHSAGSPGAVFRTGFGLPLYAFVILLILNFINLFVLQLHGTSSALVALQLLWVLMLIVMVYVMLSTDYRVKDGVLQVRMGPFSRRIDLESISSIFLEGRTFRGRLYGLGTHLVGIDYRGGSVSITPKDIDGFLAAIGARRTESGDVATIG